MEYEFRKDFISGNSIATFSLEHEVFAPWLEQELGKNIGKIDGLLQQIENLSTTGQPDLKLVGKEFSLIVDSDDVEVVANISFDDLQIPELAIESIDDSEQFVSAMCGLEDFIVMLNSWREFVASK